MKKQHIDIVHVTGSFTSVGAYQNKFEILQTFLCVRKNVIYITLTGKYI